jgi:hypothetical protein
LLVCPSRPVAYKVKAVTVVSLPLEGVLAEKREAILKQWLACAVEAYPGHAAGFLLHNKDPFRNPVGHSLKQGLEVLFEEVLHDFDAARVSPALDSIVRIRAVQDASPSEAVAFIFLLRRIIREELPAGAGDLRVLDGRIDEMALLAFDLFVKCREKIYELKANEAKRSIHVQLRRNRKGEK